METLLVVLGGTDALGDAEPGQDRVVQVNVRRSLEGV